MNKKTPYKTGIGICCNTNNCQSQNLDILIQFSWFPAQIVIDRTNELWNILKKILFLHANFLSYFIGHRYESQSLHFTN